MEIAISGPIPPDAAEAARIAEERINEIEAYSCFEKTKLKIEFIQTDSDGNRVVVRDNNIAIYAGMVREFITGVGNVLKMLYRHERSVKMPPCGEWTDMPKFPVRVHYLPAHFGNSFEAAWPFEMQRYLEDLALAGASGYGDWFDPNDMPDPYNPFVYCSTSMTLWRKKKEFLKISKRLGLDNVLCITHNVGFTDQMRPEWAGIKDHTLRVQGQVLCPSIPEARKVCLQNQDNLFRDLSESGVIIDKVIYGPYDDGGCGCSKCQPYYPTFLSLISEIQNIVLKYYPGIKADIGGWWALDEELRMVAGFIRGSEKKLFSGFQFSATYDVFELPDIRCLIGNIPLSAFLHIAFSNNDRDVYIKTGIHSAARRIKSVVKSFDNQGCLGFYTYNESFGDHFNEYVSNCLGRNPDESVKEITGDYCRMMFGVNGQNLEDIVDVLLEMEDPDNEKAGRWQTVLNGIRPHIKTSQWQGWAFDHILYKAELTALDYKIGDGKEWGRPEDLEGVLPLIEKRLMLSEVLWRKVYGFGVLRHILIPDRMLPDWYDNYRRIFPERNGMILPGLRENKISENA